MMITKDLQVRKKQELTTPMEQTRPGLVFTPEVDILENDRDIILLADTPGAAADDIAIELQKNVLTVSGDVKPLEIAEESDVLVEFEVGKYYRQFSLSDVIDQEKIEAKIEDGVLRLVLPKVEKALPKKIAVTVS